MSELIIFPSPLNYLGGYIKQALAAAGKPVPVSSQIPNDLPRAGASKAAFVRVDVLDRHRTGLVTEDVTLALEAYADGPDASETLAGLLRAIAWTAPEDPSVDVLSVRELSGPSPLPDPRTGLHRTTQTVVFAMRGTAA